MKMIPKEQYTLTLTHEYIDDDGERNTLDEPIKVNYIVLRTGYLAQPLSIVINEMMDSMKHYLLQIAGMGDGND